MLNDVFGQSRAIGISTESKVRLVVEGFDDETLWLTSFQGDIEPNYQLMYSLGAEVFINTFSDKLSLFKLGGVYVMNLCNQDGTGTPAFMSFYRARNIAVSDEPLRIALNSIVITGFLVMLTIGKFTQEVVEGHRFTLTFLGMLDQSLAGANGFRQTGSGGS